MSRSLLLDIARESITEVFEAQRTIDKEKLFTEYPVLKEPVGLFVSVHLAEQLRGSMGSVIPQNSLLEDLISFAKKAAFEDENFEPLRISEYLQASLEVSLLTPLTELEYTSIEEIEKQVHSHEDGLVISLNEHQAAFLPDIWLQVADFNELFTALLKQSGLTSLDQHPKVFTFQVEKQRDEPTLR